MTIDEALSGAAGLAGVQWVLYGAPVQRALQELLATLLAPPATVRACRLLRAKVKPGRKLTAYYEVELAGQSDAPPQPRAIAVTWTVQPAQTALPVSTMEAVALESGVAAPFRRLLASDDKWRMQIEVAPLDPAFPHLVRAMTPAKVVALLSEQDIPAADWRITTLRYRPRQRHVLRYDPVLATGFPATPFFAKLSQQKEGETTAQIVDWAAAQLAQRKLAVVALCPRAWLADEQLLLYPYAPGTTVSQLLLTNQPVLPLLHRAGAALRALHDAPCPTVLPLVDKTFVGEAKATLQAGEQLAALAPTLSTTFATLVDAVHERYHQLPAAEPTFTHSDFKADHLLADGNRLTLIDFDSCAMTDPAADLGKFLADLHWWQVMGGRFDRQRAQAAFLAGYGPPTDPDLYRRAQLYRTLILAKNTVRRLNRFDERWLAQSQALLHCAMALLHQA
ncbi:MAG: aminoglycoside phosphotransferase family protein [Caldilinea sp. CFX5]|nr:aminoglycoside phosphotransferase family protein [Caldilinea sp. CFX5]